MLRDELTLDQAIKIAIAKKQRFNHPENELSRSRIWRLMQLMENFYPDLECLWQLELE
ncbi:MAG: hypothetical protein MZV64_04440 [Ignavibacteriales bacterium]|nr:hypothetical protein [Ignavibacteriales bacterium]